MAFYHVNSCDCPVGCCDCYSSPSPKFVGYLIYLEGTEVTVKEYWENTVNKNQQYTEFFLYEEDSVEYYNMLLDLFKKSKTLTDLQDTRPYKKVINPRTGDHFYVRH